MTSMAYLYLGLQLTQLEQESSGATPQNIAGLDWRPFFMAIVAGCAIAWVVWFKCSRWTNCRQNLNKKAPETRDIGCQTYDTCFNVCLQCHKPVNPDGTVKLDHLDQLEETIEECATLQLKDFHVSIPEGAIPETPLNVTLTLGNISKFYQMLRVECILDGIKLAPYSLILQPHGQHFKKAFHVALDTPLAWLLGYPMLLHKSDATSQWEDRTENYQLQCMDGRLMYDSDQFCEHFLVVMTETYLGIDACRAFLLDCFNGYKSKIFFRLQRCTGYPNKTSESQFRFLLLCSTEEDSQVLHNGRDIAAHPCGEPVGHAWSSWPLTDGTPLAIYTNQERRVLTFTLNLVMCRQEGIVMQFECFSLPGGSLYKVGIRMIDPFTGKEVSTAEMNPLMNN